MLLKLASDTKTHLSREGNNCVIQQTTPNTPRLPGRGQVFTSLDKEKNPEIFGCRTQEARPGGRRRLLQVTGITASGAKNYWAEMAALSTGVKDKLAVTLRYVKRLC